MFFTVDRKKREDLFRIIGLTSESSIIVSDLVGVAVNIFKQM